MDKNASFLLGNFSGQPVSVLPGGRFTCGAPLLGTWLAAYTPLAGAMLLTADPPAGFIGLKHADMAASLQGSSCTLTYSNLPGTALSVELQPISTPKKPNLTRVQINMLASNNTRNPMPISLAFSWQDLRGLPPRGSQCGPQSIAIQLGGGGQITATCARPRTHFTCCTGWDPSGSGEEMWDDFFAYGELSGQQHAASASAICAHNLVGPNQDFNFTITLQSTPAD